MIPPILALYIWPVISIVFFRKYPLPLAVCLTLLGGYLLLPERTAIDLPLLPTLDKQSISALTAFIAVIILTKQDRWSQDKLTYPTLSGFLPRHPIALLLIGGIIIGAFMTVQTNGDMLVYGPTVLPAMRPYDAFSVIMASLITLLPMFLARKLFAQSEQQRFLLLPIAIAGFAYTFPALFEVRMSPQLHTWIYGFFQSSFPQHYRASGFRPIVFLPHGLWLSIFFMMTAAAAFGLWRLKIVSNKKYLWAAIWISLSLVASKSLGAMMIATVLIPIILFLTVRMQLIVAAIIASIFLTYPVLRSADRVPLDRVITFAASIDPQRAGSFETRIINEDIMLEKALQRPVFGWGGWGRSRVVSENGLDGTIADGYWTIVLGVGGWTKYVSEFGLLSAPIFLLLLGFRKRKVGLETGILAIMLAGNLIDLIPNATITPVTWILAGTLWGRLEVVSDVSVDETKSEAEPSFPEAISRPGPAYTRQAKLHTSRSRKEY